MHLFSTILFVDGNPVKYEVHFTDRLFLLHPTDNPNDHIEPPSIEAKWCNGNWKVSGTTDEDLVAQVIEDIDQNSANFPSAN